MKADQDTQIAALRERPPQGLTSYWQVSAFLCTCLVIVLRRPDAILHAQFLYEDGQIWYADAYNHGWWRALFITHQGYFETIPRLGAALAILFPFSLAPLIQNLFAICIQAAPVSVLLSSRSSRWGSLSFRFSMAATYLLLPNTQDMMSTITESQWFLAIVAFLVLTARPAHSKSQHIFDILIISLCGLTGPFCIFLFPIALYQFRSRRVPKILLIILFSGCLIQAATLLIAGNSREHPPLGIGFGAFFRILTGQVFMGSTIGHNSFGVILPVSVLTMFSLLGLSILVGSFIVSTTEMRSFLIWSITLFTVSVFLTNEMPPPGVTEWHMLAVAYGLRYWLFPCLAFAWCILYGYSSRRQTLRIACGALICLMMIGFMRDFRYRPLPDMKFNIYAAQLASAPSGSQVLIPTPFNWPMVLIKH
ncbi:hypothetical protein P8935_20550 [Telmatobacter sp. DSM 110680]|uniref:Uncharacterized protein n=1 Tax=Telmatobacter sp. DSM 110680 TaxID=3036704 RepID=A0AAU7DIN6_9BACT